MNTANEHPPISGRLYNCALNCAIPKIMTRLSEISLDENLAYIQAYQDLKFCFEQRYQIKESLSFANFYTILTSWTHSELELILAPVLRQFLVSKSLETDQKDRLGCLIEYKNQFIDKEIIDAHKDENMPIAWSLEGRYIPLACHEANEYFYKHLGFYFQVTEAGQVQNPLPLDSTLEVINAYLKTGHFELSENPAFKNLNEKFKDSFLMNAYEKLILDDSYSNTKNVLESLIPFVSSKASKDLGQKQKVLTKQEYQNCLKTYKTSYVLWNCLLYFISFGYWTHQSGTFNALKSLESQNEIKKEDIEKILMGKNIHDSGHQRRYLFWSTHNSANFFKENSATDRVLRTLKQKF